MTYNPSNRPLAWLCVGVALAIALAGVLSGLGVIGPATHSMKVGAAMACLICLPAAIMAFDMLSPRNERSAKVLAGAAVVALGALLLSLPAKAAQRTISLGFTAKVIYVNDGDTVVALKPSGERVSVRLANIDAPETHKNRCKPGQPWAQKSTESLSRLVKGKTIQFVCHELDRYDRNVCDLQVGQTTASRVLASEGLAWANRANPRYLRDHGVADAEHDARAKGLGLWGDPARVEPWIWRRTRWTSSC